MATNSTKTFGKKISREQANQMFKTFLKIKRRSVSKITDALSGDKESVRLHCGRDGFLDIAYVFDKAIVEEMMAKISSDEGGLILFKGARDCDGNDTDGRPTLLIFPFKYSKAKATTKTGDDTNLEVLLDDGAEHPGTGGDNGGVGDGGDGVEMAKKSFPVPSEIPASLLRSSIVN